MNAVKGIRVLTDKGNIEDSCIWKSYWNIFPWRKRNDGIFYDAKAKYAPTTAMDILETDDESAFLDAKEVEDDSDKIEKTCGRNAKAQAHRHRSICTEPSVRLFSRFVTLGGSQW